MAENAAVGGNGNGSDDKTVARSPCKKLNVSTGYLIFLCPEKMSLPDNPNHRLGS